MPLPKYKVSNHDIAELRTMEESIRKKNNSIKQIEEDIKNLKAGLCYENKKLVNPDPNLAKEIKYKRDNLTRLQSELTTKQTKAN